MKLTLAIAAINSWNRLNIAFRVQAGGYQPACSSTPWVSESFDGGSPGDEPLIGRRHLPIHRHARAD